MITLVLRSIIIYIIVLVAVRLMGKRQIGDMQPFELVVTFIIADLACIPMSDVSIPLVFGIIPLLTLVVLHHLLTVKKKKSITFRKILNGRPIIVIDKNGINYKALQQLNMTLNDLTEGLRAVQCFNLQDVAYAIVETNGVISVLLKQNLSPATKEDLKVKTAETTLNVILINDGKIVNDNLKNLNLDVDFLNSIIKKQNTKSISDVLILTINTNGEIFYQEKHKKAQSFNVEVNL